MNPWKRLAWAVIPWRWRRRYQVACSAGFVTLCIFQADVASALVAARIEDAAQGGMALGRWLMRALEDSISSSVPTTEAPPPSP